MPDELGDLLQRRIARTQDGHERMTQLAGSPLLPQPGRPGDLGQLPAHLPAIQRSAIIMAEHKDRDPATHRQPAAAALGWQVVDRGSYGVSIGADGVPFEIDFRFVPDGPKPAKNRLHLDIKPINRDQAAELDRLLGLGARRVDVGQGARNWFVLADPEGNEFCLCRP
jgi:Glyoxalase-like domain